MNRKSLLFRLILFSSLLSILPILGIGSIVYLMIYRDVSARISQQAHEIVESAVSHVESVNHVILGSLQTELNVIRNTFDS